MPRFPSCRFLPLLVLAAAGCSALEPDDPLERANVKEALARLARPLPGRAALYVSPAPRPAPAEGHAASFSLDALSLSNDLKNLLQRARVFEGVEEILPRMLEGDPPGKKARKLGFAYLIRVDPGEGRVFYIGRNVWWWPSFALWLLAWVPSWLVADETYGIETRATVEAIDLRREASLGSFPAGGAVTARLSDVERGFHLFGIFSAPYCLSRFDYRSIRRKLEPRGFARFHETFLIGLARALEKGAK